MTSENPQKNLAHLTTNQILDLSKKIYVYGKKSRQEYNRVFQEPRVVADFGGTFHLWIEWKPCNDDTGLDFLYIHKIQKHRGS